MPRATIDETIIDFRNTLELTGMVKVRLAQARKNVLRAAFEVSPAKKDEFLSFMAVVQGKCAELRAQVMSTLGAVIVFDGAKPGSVSFINVEHPSATDDAALLEAFNVWKQAFIGCVRDLKLVQIPEDDPDTLPPGHEGEQMPMPSAIDYMGGAQRMRKLKAIRDTKVV